MARSQPSDDSVAIIGAGAAGLGAAWLLARSGFRVHLYEASSHAGGHAHTIDLPIPNGPTFATIPIDVGFIVYNTSTYPDLVSLFEMLDVEEENSSMSFASSVHLPKSKVLLEWGSDSLTTLFADRANLYRTSMYTMLYDMRRFNNAVYDFVNRLDTNPHFPDADISLGEFLSKGSYSTTFIRGYLIPMVSAVWSASFNLAMKFPARALFRFFVNHGLAQVFARPQWRTPAKRSRDYVSRIVNQIRENGGIVSLETPVSSVKRRPSNVTVHAENCDPKDFDHVIFATHAPTTLEILGDGATEDEKRVLGAFRYSVNTGYVHTDPRLMPVNKSVWSAWNFIGRRPAEDETNTSRTDCEDDDPVCISYWLNKLQNLHKSPNPVPDLFLTLNPISQIDPDKKLLELTYEHPQFTEEAVRVQPRIQTDLQGRNRSWFCGAYARYGFHEDSLMTGLDVAERLSGNRALRPWRAKQNLAINDHSRPYEVPYSPTKSSSFFILFALLVISSVLSRLQQGLGKLAFRMADNVPVVVIAVGNGRMYRFGPRRKRSKSVSSLNLLRNDDHVRSTAEGPGELDRARITVKSPRVLVRIADALRHGYDLATTAAAAFTAREFDCPTPTDLSVALRALFIADRLDLEPSGARKGRAKLAESLLRSFVGSIQRPSTLPTNTRLPELTTCITSVVYPSWWLEIGEPNDAYSSRLMRVPSMSTDGWFDEKTAMNILEMVGDLSDITVSSLQKNGEARATIVVQTSERVGFVTRKAELLSVSEQIQVLLVEDFLKQSLEPFDSGALENDPKQFNLILSPALVNAYKCCGFDSLGDALMFLRETATMDATFELGCTVFGTRPPKAHSKPAKGTDSLFSGDKGFVLWKAGDLIECVEKHSFDLERMSFLNHDEASADVFEVIERVHGSLATDKLKPDETRTALAQMCLWQAALKVKYVRRMTLSFRMG
ncbi:Flavin containing amine oxidoreductase [Gracilaria domingensis]|nr:Flavin containing amine oxidoreductase [Gracilaria domingensis]